MGDEWDALEHYLLATWRAVEVDDDEGTESHLTVAGIASVEELGDGPRPDVLA